MLEIHVLVIHYIHLDTLLLVKNNQLKFKIREEFPLYLSGKLIVITLKCSHWH